MTGVNASKTCSLLGDNVLLTIIWIPTLLESTPGYNRAREYCIAAKLSVKDWPLII